MALNNMKERGAESVNMVSGANFVILTLTIFTAFLIFGLSENVKGPAIPSIQSDFGIDEFQVGLLLAINAFGYLIACGYTAPLAAKSGLRPTLAVSLIGMALSGIGICLSPGFLPLALSFFVMYLGNGMLEITLGLMAATIFTKNTGAMLNISHFFYGLGSMIGPVLSARLMAATMENTTLGWRYMYLIILSFALIPLILGLIGRMAERSGDRQKLRITAFLKKPWVWPIILGLSLSYVCEMGIGGWLVNFLEKAYAFESGDAAFILAAFFACFTAARLILGPLTDKVGFTRSMLIATSFSGLAIIIGVAAGRPGIALLIIAGIGVAPIYPTMLAIVAKLFADDIYTAMTVILTVLGIISMISNLMLGGIVDGARHIFTQYYGEAGVGIAYSAGIMFLGLCCLVAFAATLVLYRELKRDGKMV
ncbi:MAG: MFS transporter [Clostridiales Family XIII bacterium]|jgi:MFS family permease|nr:MFS transporter [Clostridiales Family XIII bacterium]